ncbi:MAG: hypothetical protein ACKVZ6_17530 [Kineosporiaceae bacterium]
MSLIHRVVVLRAQLVVARAARRWRRQLRCDLATYSTQSQRDDLLATFDRYPDDVTHEYREILARQAASDECSRRWPAMGRR